MFQVKICGVRTVGDALAACAARADALGLNFVAGSVRYVDETLARQIAAAVPASVAKVGVFVNAEIPLVRQYYDTIGLDLVQLHGDEPPEYVAELAGIPVIKAFRLSAEGLQPVRQYLDRCQQLGCRPQAVLADAYRPGEYGGTGLALDWPAISSWREILGETSFVLAGGLKPENVGQAIGIVRPSGVDTASGVEKAPGVKDASLMQAYAAAARDALAAVSSCQSTRANLS